MGVETETDVQQVQRVQNAKGERVAPATERAAKGVYPRGNSSRISAYPKTVDPNAEIHELLVFSVPASVEIEITTEGGDVFNLPHDGSGGVFSSWQIDSIKVSDPDNSGSTTRLAWAGE